MGIYKDYVEQHGPESYHDLTFEFTKRFYLRPSQIKQIRQALERTLQIHYHDYDLHVQLVENKKVND